MFIAPRTSIGGAYDWVCGACQRAWPKDHPVCGMCVLPRSAKGNKSLIGTTWIEHNKTAAIVLKESETKALINAIQSSTTNDAKTLVPKNLLDAQLLLRFRTTVAGGRGSCLHLAIEKHKPDVFLQLFRFLPQLMFIPWNLGEKSCLTAIHFLHQINQTNSGSETESFLSSMTMLPKMSVRIDVCWWLSISEMDKHWRQQVARLIVIIGRRSPSSPFSADKLPSVMLQLILGCLSPKWAAIPFLTPDVPTHPAHGRRNSHNLVVADFRRRKDISQQRRLAAVEQQSIDNALGLPADLIPCHHAGCKMQIPFADYDQHLLSHIVSTPNLRGALAAVHGAQSATVGHAITKHSYRNVDPSERPAPTTTAKSKVVTPSSISDAEYESMYNRATANWRRPTSSRRAERRQRAAAIEEVGRRRKQEEEELNLDAFSTNNTLKAETAATATPPTAATATASAAVAAAPVESAFAAAAVDSDPERRAEQAIDEEELAAALAASLELTTANPSVPSVPSVPPAPIELDLFSKHSKPTASEVSTGSVDAAPSIQVLSEDKSSLSEHKSDRLDNKNAIKEEVEKKSKPKPALLPCEVCGLPTLENEYANHVLAHKYSNEWATASAYAPPPGFTTPPPYDDDDYNGIRGGARGRGPAPTRMSAVTADQKTRVGNITSVPIKCDHPSCGALVEFDQYASHQTAHRLEIENRATATTTATSAFSSVQSDRRLSPNSVRKRLFAHLPAADAAPARDTASVKRRHIPSQISQLSTQPKSDKQANADETRWWCHTCEKEPSQTVTTLEGHVKCGKCNDVFVEKIDPRDPPLRAQQQRPKPTLSHDENSRPLWPDWKKSRPSWFHGVASSSASPPPTTLAAPPLADKSAEMAVDPGKPERPTIGGGGSRSDALDGLLPPLKCAFAGCGKVFSSHPRHRDRYRKHLSEHSHAHATPADTGTANQTSAGPVKKELEVHFKYNAKPDPVVTTATTMRATTTRALVVVKDSSGQESTIPLEIPTHLLGSLESPDTPSADLAGASQALLETLIKEKQKSKSKPDEKQGSQNSESNADEKNVGGLVAGARGAIEWGAQFAGGGGLQLDQYWTSPEHAAIWLDEVQQRWTLFVTLEYMESRRRSAVFQLPFTQVLARFHSIVPTGAWKSKSSNVTMSVAGRFDGHTFELMVPIHTSIVYTIGHSRPHAGTLDWLTRLTAALDQLIAPPLPDFIANRHNCS